MHPQVSMAKVPGMDQTSERMAMEAASAANQEDQAASTWPTKYMGNIMPFRIVCKAAWWGTIKSFSIPVPSRCFCILDLSFTAA